MSYSSDLITRSQLALHRPTPAVHPDIAVLTPVSEHRDEADSIRCTTLANALSKLQSKSSHNLTSLRNLISTTFPSSVEGALDTPVGVSPEVEADDLLVLSQLIVLSYGMIINQFVLDHAKLDAEKEYWKKVGQTAWSTSEYLVQTAPPRLLAMSSISLAHLRRLTSSSTALNPLSFGYLQQALPFSLLITAIFPHLSLSSPSFTSATFSNASSTLISTSKTSMRQVSRHARRLLSLSPLSLTRQEVAIKYRSIEHEQDRLAERIGRLTLASERYGGLLQNEPPSGEGVDPGRMGVTVETTKSRIWSTLVTLDKVVSTFPTLSLSTPPTNTKELALLLAHLFEVSIPTYSTAVSTSLLALSRPSLLVRSWPYLFSLPVISLLLGRRIYAARFTLLGYAADARGTIADFLVDWVFEPLRKIIITIRHGEGGSMTLMSRDSLKSDLASLERMVVEFGRDEYGLSVDQLSELGRKVKEGDMTSVLQAFEKDIRHPLRSVVAGSLIRTLLIQVQKLKVDLGLAMDGIEKMLASQQLTFGFVGVAPSLLVVAASARWLKRFLSRDGGSRRQRKAVRSRTWTTLRHLDAIVSPVSPRTSEKDGNSAARIQGYLLLELQSLRTYAQSTSFPSRDLSLREAFLDDVRALEDCSNDTKGRSRRMGTEEDATDDAQSRRIVLDRLWRWRSELKEEEED